MLSYIHTYRWCPSTCIDICIFCSHVDLHSGHKIACAELHTHPHWMYQYMYWYMFIMHTCRPSFRPQNRMCWATYTPTVDVAAHILIYFLFCTHIDLHSGHKIACVGLYAHLHFMYQHMYWYMFLLQTCRPSFRLQNHMCWATYTPIFDVPVHILMHVFSAHMYTSI